MVALAETLSPDIETSSEQYATRFSGGVGRYFLDRQAKLVASLIRQHPAGSLRILDVGGGHAQLTPTFLSLGHEVWVHGTHPSCEQQLLKLKERGEKIRFVVSPLSALPFPAESFDVVTSFRLLAHLDDAREFIEVLTRVARRQVIFDYAPLCSFNALSPVLFSLKKRIEGNTRPFHCHTFRELRRELARCDFGQARALRQFFMPMGVHRALDNPNFTQTVESGFEKIGLTQTFGSPVIVSAYRKKRGGESRDG